ncbi:MAG: DUF4386 domain-containing protein [Acidobacteria bacterium]|nr:DUF4386 domain-containing protein [Acidobacteriota bacterium]
MLSTSAPAQRTAARVAGCFILFTMATILFANFAVNERLVAGNAAEIARNILAHQTLFRLSIACDLLYCAGVVVLLTALYVILRPVNRGVAVLGACFRLLYLLMWMVIALNSLYALRLLNGAEYLRVFEAERLQALARLSIANSFDVYYVGLLFYALASTVCGYLWLKSGYIPRALAAFGVLASAFCAACTFVFIISPGFSKVVNLWWFDSPMALFELAAGLWLLFKGLRLSGRVEAAT